MDSLCTPAVATAALFTALLFLDLFRREYKLLPGHAVFGLLATLLMTVLCQKGAPMTAWGLLALPFLFLVIGWMVWAIQDEKQAARPTYPIGPKPARNPCRTCEENKPVGPCSKCRCKRPGSCPLYDDETA
jgi:hypothetical protein